MSTTIRTMTPADFPQVVALTQAAFAGNDGEQRRSEIAAGLRLAYDVGDIMKWEHGFVAEVDGRVVSVGQVLDLRMRVGVATLRVAGMHALATDPTVGPRSLILPMVRQGRRVLAQSFDLALGFTRHDDVFSVLGGSTVAAEYEWRLDAGAVEADAGDFRPAQDDDLVRLLALAESASNDRPLTLLRDPSVWAQLERRPRELWISADSFVGLRRNADSLELRDVGATSEAEYPRILRFLVHLARRAGYSQVFAELPHDHPLVMASLPFGGVCRATLTPGRGCMAGLIDVGRFLRQLAPELERRARAVSEDAFSLDVTCGGVRHGLMLGPKGTPSRARVNVDGAGGAILQWLLGTPVPHGLALEVNGAPAELGAALGRTLLPHSRICDRW